MDFGCPWKSKVMIYVDLLTWCRQCHDEIESSRLSHRSGSVPTKVPLLPINGVTHRKVEAGRPNVSHQMASVFLSDNTGLFTDFIFTRAENMITMSYSKWPIKMLYIMHVIYMLDLVYGLSLDIY